MNRGEAICGLCQSVQPPFVKAAAYGSYSGGLRDLIHLLKYERVRPAAGVLGRMLAEVMAGLATGIPESRIAVLPVPLHPHKQAQRGFNQSELIAGIALKQLRRPDRFELCPELLVRRRETGSQIGLSRHQRRENLHGAFVVADDRQLSGRSILLVDDVYTTGMTVSECARILRRAGAGNVWVATVARTLKVVESFAVPEDLDEASEDRQTLAAHG